MINDNTILSSFDDKPTLLEWLKKVEDALKSDTATAVSVENPSANTYVFKITFADGNTLSSGNVIFPDSVKDVSIKNGHIIVTSVGGNVEDLGVLNPYADTIVVNAETHTTEIGGKLQVSGEAQVTGNVATGGNLGVTGQAVVGGALGVTGNATIGGRLQTDSSIISNGEIRGGNISGTKFLLGTEEMPLVKANPTGEATETLEKIKIGNVAYNVGGGGGITKRSLTIPKSELSLGHATSEGAHLALILSETARQNFINFYNGSNFDDCMISKVIMWYELPTGKGSPVEVPATIETNKSTKPDGFMYMGSGGTSVSSYYVAYGLSNNESEACLEILYADGESFDQYYGFLTRLEIIEYII